MMIGLGQIPSIGNTSNRVFEARLFQEVAKVDEKEAEQGALHSDALRLSSKDQESNSLLSRKGITNRLSRLWLNLKPKAQENKPEEKEDDCPIAQARAESQVGQNAPLGWLTLDNLLNSSSTPQSGKSEGDTLVATKTEAPAKESTSLSFLRSDPDDADYMFNDEWFLSPNG